MGNIHKEETELIGNTPLLHLDFGMTQAEIYVKVETHNLTGSVKDRMACYMLQKAEERGALKKGGTIIEATTGNTGIAFAALGAIFGYKMIAVMPEGQSIERIGMMKAYGAKVILTPKKEGPLGAINFRDKLAKKTPLSWIPGQFTNPDNTLGQYHSLGQEIIRQMKNKPDYFVHGIGTGGTFMGVSKALKEEYPEIISVAVEPAEAAVLSGEKVKGPHNIQGIGEGFIPEIVNPKFIDRVVKVETGEAVEETGKISMSHGILAGFSSGANIAAIRKIAVKLHEPAIFLTVFADRGERYLSCL